jgi:hypothetical protein
MAEPKNVGGKTAFSLERLPSKHEDDRHIPMSSDNAPYYPKLARSTLRLVLLTLFYLVFLVIGASIFSAIESPGEISMIKDVADVRRNFIDNHGCMSGEAPYLLPTTSLPYATFLYSYSVNISKKNS